MQCDAQRFLRLVEKAKTICFFDIEATGLRGDYSSILVVSIKPYKEPPRSYTVKVPGKDKDVIERAGHELEQFDCWVSYYGKGFDIPMLNTRRLRWGLDPIQKRHHLDLYYTIRAHTITAHRSLAHIMSWLGTTDNTGRPVDKMGVSATVWSEVAADPERHLKVLTKRCEADCVGLEAAYDKTNHLVQEVTR